MSDGTTVLNRPHPNDGFRASVARHLREKGRAGYESNPDAPGATRRLHAIEHLARYLELLPLSDPRFRLLLRTSRDSDIFTGSAERFLAQIGLDQPAPPNVDAQLSEFVVEATSSLGLGLASAEKDAIEAKHVGARQQAEARIEELEAGIARRDKEIAEQSQELSDLRGRLKRSDAADIEALERQVAQLQAVAKKSPARKAKTKAAA